MTAKLPAVSWSFGPSRAGWCCAAIRVGDAADEISLSYAFDPWDGLVDFHGEIARGGIASLEIEEEGPTTVLWATREPGSNLVRLRVFEPGAFGEVETSHIDATIDGMALCAAFVEAFQKHLAEDNPDDWDDEIDVKGEVAKDLSFRHLISSLKWIGILHDDDGDMRDPLGEERRNEERARYDAELGPNAIPDIRKNPTEKENER
jgi:hypothetical protein